MKLMEAISAVDALKPNTYSQEEKISWLSRVDGLVKGQIVDIHKGADAVTFEGYTTDTPLDTQLLVPAPYDELYLRYLEAQIDYHNAEYDRYNNAILMFSTIFDDYAKHYIRTHMPLGKGGRFLF